MFVKRNKNIFGLLIVLLVMSTYFTIQAPVFLSLENLSNILMATATIAILAIGATFVIGSKGLDLSIGSLMAFSACSAGSLFLAFGLDGYTTIFACLLVGTLVGTLNGFLIAYISIPAFIATLGVMTITRGGSLVVNNGMPVYGMPDEVVFIGQGSVLGIPTPVIILLTLIVLAHILMTKTSFGRHTLAIGDNEQAVRNAGINVKKHKLKIYILSGFLAAVAGLVFMGRVNAADPNAGLTYEMTAITATIIGGTHLFGGRASVIGALLGALIMGVLQNGLNLLAVPSYYQLIAIGVVLIAAVWFDQVQRKKA